MIKMDVNVVLGVCVSAKEYAKIHLGSRHEEMGQNCDTDNIDIMMYVCEWDQRAIETPTLVTNLILYDIPHDIRENGNYGFDDIVIGLQLTMVSTQRFSKQTYKPFHSLSELPLDRFKQEILAINANQPDLGKLLTQGKVGIHVLRSDCLCCT